jgi:hypothetical protein
MARKASTGGGTTAADIVQMLVETSGADTVYADIHLGRARELLDPLLPVAHYRAIQGLERDIDDAVKQSKAAARAQDWQRVDSLAGHVETLRQRAQEKASMRIDPFSPGFEFLPDYRSDLAALRDSLLDTFKALAAADAPRAALYESRRAFFAAFALLSKRGEATAPAARDRAELEQLAAQAAQQGDMAQLRRYAQELMAQPATAAPAAAHSDAPAAPVDRGVYQCPLDLAVPFAADVVQRAQALGLAAVRTQPIPQAGPLLDYVNAHVWQPDLAGGDTEREGTMRTEAIVEETGFPREVSEQVKVLVGQFLRNPFVNSGGARYLPQFSAEAVLIEDFPEDPDPPATGELLSALGLPRRRGLARAELDRALHEHGAKILADRLTLDPVEFRLVCVPHDLYMRCGRERGWGQREQWTHFDGYQLLKTGRLRALVGGDVRYGGLSDLVSIGTTDERESVGARFAVIRRARQVARWR